jgi:class 3 adenylate cyclase
MEILARVPRRPFPIESRTSGHELEHVAILFTDVVGSTELLERLGDEAAHQLRRRHFALLRRVIDDHGGREVKSLGDGLMVAFAGAREAVACALAMQRGVTTSGQPLELRIGIAAGEAVREDGDYFGRPVIVARRLCDAARGGEVFVSEPTPELPTDRRADEVQPLGRLWLKGLRDPVVAAVLRPRPLALSA